MHKISQPTIQQQTSWLSKPTPGHLVHFYDFESTLSSSLRKYIGDGIKDGDICIVIATKKHADALNTSLELDGIDIAGALASKQYIVLDAEKTLQAFMKNGTPEWKLFCDTVGSIVSQAAKENKPIRAFGEMVALLWKEGNFQALTTLENYWNDLGNKYTFSLYCAYPLITFDRNIHDSAMEAINNLHTHTHPVFASFKRASPISV